jgi:anti-sigma B factor antagonist
MATSLSVRKEGPLNVRIDQDGHSLSVRASGEVDISNAKFLEEELRRVLVCDAPLIILELDKVDFIDSTGLRVLLWCAGHSRENGNRVRMRLGSDAVRRMVELTGVESALPQTA